MLQSRTGVDEVLVEVWGNEEPSVRLMLEINMAVPSSGVRLVGPTRIAPRRAGN
jgi:hypothetical protein